MIKKVNISYKFSSILYKFIARCIHDKDKEMHLRQGLTVASDVVLNGTPK